MVTHKFSYDAPAPGCGDGYHVSVTQPTRSRVHAEPGQIYVLTPLFTPLSRTSWPKVTMRLCAR
jgi:hypothetical protein